MLILRYGSKPNDLRTCVYRDTLDYISKNVPSSVEYLYKNDKELLEFIRKHKFMSVVSTNELTYETSLLLKGLDLIQISIGKNADLVEISDIIIDPLIKKSYQYLAGTKYLLPSVLKKYGADTLARALHIDQKSFLAETIHSQAESEILDVIELFQKLQWDSEFFGINIGYVSSLRLTPNIERCIKSFVRRKNIHMLEYCCNCHDKKSVSTAERNGYSFVDIRLTFEQILSGDISPEGGDGFQVRKAGEGDIKILKKLTQNIYSLSRYYYDTNFDRAKVEEFYSGWIEKAVRGTFDNFAYVLCKNNKPIGFCSIRLLPKNCASIGLFGMASAYAGKGLSKFLLDTVLRSLKNDGIRYMVVVTQGRNYAAQRLYQRSGFLTKSVELWYHKWFR